MYGVEKALRMELTVLDSRCRYINILDIHCHTVQQNREIKEQQYHGMRSSQENGVGHVAIYIGDNQIIHAGSKDTGINVRNADYRAVWGVRRIVQ